MSLVPSARALAAVVAVGSLGPGLQADELNLTRCPGWASRPEVEERYCCTAAGTFEVTLALVADGFHRTFRIARAGGAQAEGKRAAL